jgi:hypothetical protein
MANDYIKSYLDVLDAVYKKVSVTSILDAMPGEYRQDELNAQVIYTRRLSFNEGQGTYDRAAGYDDGTVEAKWEPHTFAMDRGKMFDFDAMDEIEAKQSAVEVAAEFYRTASVPELDSYRFSKMFAIKTAADAYADLAVDTVITAIDTAIEALDDAEVPEEGRILFVTPGTYNLMKNSGDVFNTRVVTERSTEINRNITTFDNMPLIRVPKSRFSTVPVFSATNGWAVGGHYLNFVIIHKPAVIAVVKHVRPKLIFPDNHFTKDAYRAAIRMYHDLFVPINKKSGIYMHRKSTGI